MAGGQELRTTGQGDFSPAHRGWLRILPLLLGLIAVVSGTAAALKTDSAPLGSGDGRIHVIPALSRPSVKNGESLTIQAIVKAPAGVASVEAIIERASPSGTVNWATADIGALLGLPVARLNLRPTSGDSGGANGIDPVGLWQADWTAQGLEEAWYRVTLTITDQSGHQFQDTTLRFSDPIAGIDAAGTTAYPNDALMRMNSLEFPFPEHSLYSAVIDRANRYAYFGANTIPGHVIKVALGEGDAPPRRVGALTMRANEAYLSCAVIDTVNGYAYFAARTTPGQVIKVALGEGDAPPTRIGAVVFDEFENSPISAIIDPANGYAYFGTGGRDPTRVVKIALGEGDAPPTRIGSVGLFAGETNLESAVIDTENGYAYFGTLTTPGRVVKVALGEGDAHPVRVDAVTLNEGEDKLFSAVIDPEGGHAWFGTDTLPGRVVKVALGEGDAPPARLGATILNDGEDRLTSAIIDPERRYAWFGTTTDPGRIVKVALGDADSPPTRVASTTLNSGENQLWTAVIDGETGHAWFGTYTRPARIIKVALGEEDASPVPLGTEYLIDQGNGLSSAVIDPNTGYAYFGTRTSPGRVVKIALGGGTGPPVRESDLTLNEGENNLLSAVIDPENGYAYFGTDTFPGHVVKVALGAGDAPPTRVGAVTLNSGEDNLWSAVIDPENGYAYFGTATFPGRVVKVALGQGDAAPARAGAVTLNVDEVVLQCAVIDPENGYAYFGASSFGLGPSHVVKVALGADPDPPTRISATPENEDQFTSAVIDPENGYAYFASVSEPFNRSTVHKYALDKGDNPPRRVSYDRTKSIYTSAVIDVNSGYAWFGSGADFNGRVVGLRLGTGDAQPTHAGSLTLRRGEYWLSSAVLDPTSGYAYFGTTASPSQLIRVALSQQSFVKGTRLTLPEAGAVEALQFYSHQAVGNVRLALYAAGNMPTLLWESDEIPNTAEEDWLRVPVHHGSPESLVLPAGEYWLAWQVDTMADVPSFVPGANNSGLQVPHTFGNFPVALEAGTDTEATFSNENWAAYVVYSLLDNSPPNAIEIAPTTTGPTNATREDFTVTFDEAVQDFDDIADLDINHMGTAHTGARITGGPETYTVAIEGISGDGSFTITVSTTSDVTDLAGNGLASSVTNAPVIIDNTPPTITMLTVTPSALEPGDDALIQFGVNEMLLGDPVVRVSGTAASMAPLELTKSLSHSYRWTAPIDAPIGRITGRPLVPGSGYVNPDPWPYGPQPIAITLSDLAGNTITHTEPEGLALVSGLPLAWPLLAAIALVAAAMLTLRTGHRSKTASSKE